MRSNPFQLGAVVLVSGMLVLGGCTASNTSSGVSTSAGAAARPADPVKKVERTTDETLRAQASRTGEVYLLRGLMDIFSRGMDVMGAKLNRAGVYAMVTNHSNWEEIGRDLVRRSKTKDISYPIVIMGHSLGGNDAPKLANYLGRRGIKVSYVVTFDPTKPSRLGKNVDRAVNFYLTHDDDNRLYKSSDFKGSIQNISMDGKDGITHTSIEKNSRIQNDVIGRIMSMTKKKR